MYFKTPILSNFVSIIIVLDIYVIFYIVDDNSSIGIERRKKRCKTKKEGGKWIECLGIGD